MVQQADATGRDSAHQETNEFLSITVRQRKGQGHAQPAPAHSYALGHTCLVDRRYGLFSSSSVTSTFLSKALLKKDSYVTCLSYSTLLCFSLPWFLWHVLPGSTLKEHLPDRFEDCIRCNAFSHRYQKTQFKLA